jgi:hypothetical protein
MEKRQRKQIIIAAIYLIIFGLIGAGIFWLVKPAPSICIDKVRQCGGPCMSCEIFDLKPPEIIWIKAFPAGAQNYDLAARIRNPNLSWAAASFDYKFEVFDQSNQLLGERTGKYFLLPASDTFLIEHKFSSVRPPGRIILGFSPTLEIKWEQLKDLAGFELKSQNVSFRRLQPSETGFAELTGLAVNSSDFSFQRLIVKAVLLDERREALAANKTELFTVRAGEERFFKMVWPYQFSGEVSQPLVLVETDVFSDENFLRRYSQ